MGGRLEGSLGERDVVRREMLWGEAVIESATEDGGCIDEG